MTIHKKKERPLTFAERKALEASGELNKPLDANTEARLQCLKELSKERPLTFAEKKEFEDVGRFDDLAEAENTTATDILSKYRTYLYRCGVCCAELFLGISDATKECPLCGSSAFSLQGMVEKPRPSSYIPFSVSLPDAINCAQKGAYSMGGSPVDRETINVNKMYFSCWLTSFDYDGDIVLIPRKKHNRIGPYGIQGDFNAAFVGDVSTSGVAHIKDVIVDASSLIKEAYSSALDEYDLRKMKAFNENDLLNCFTDNIDCEESKAVELLKDLIKRPFAYELSRRTYLEGVDLLLKSTHGKVVNKKSRYILLPCYIATFERDNRTNVILINGQNGDITGPYLLDNLKVPIPRSITCAETINYYRKTVPLNIRDVRGEFAK